MGDGCEPTILTARACTSIFDIPATAWNRVASPSRELHNPFVSHEFLQALERSGSVSAQTGWTPAHIVLEEAGEIVGAAPLYLKAHSFGEYVFDHHWAEAFERAGGRYYPKLLCGVPFTPVTGPRLLAATADRRAALAQAIAATLKQTRLSSAHVNFLSESDALTLDASGFMIRTGVQYHWLNRDYKNYEAFLAALASRKRKALRRERREAAKGLTFQTIVGADLKEQHWDAFWTFYQDTGSRKWGRPYLTREFFTEIAATMADRLIMVIAEDDGRPIAGALNVIGGDVLYGRYWGCTQMRPFLHFEVCYHRAIEFAIEQGLSRVEAGAQGEHKIARGYEPVATRSAHMIANPEFRDAIARYLVTERQTINEEIAALADLTPFRDDGGG